MERNGFGMLDLFNESNFCIVVVCRNNSYTHHNLVRFGSCGSGAT